MRYLLYSLLVLNINLLANEPLKDSFDWDGALKQTTLLWDKTKKITVDAVDGTKTITADGIAKTKNIFLQGRKLLLEKTLLTSINLGLDYNDTIYVHQLSLNEENGTLSLQIELQGEGKELLVEVNHFDWDIIEDKKFIILENLDISLDIPWLDYLFQKYLKRNNGYVKLSYSLAKESFLKSLKEKKRTTYLESISTKELEDKENLEQLQKIKEILEINGEERFTTLFREFYDEIYIKPNFIQQTKEGIAASFSFFETQDDFRITIIDFDWATANEKKLIILGNITFKDCTKPWIASLLDKHKEQIIFDFKQSLETILASIKPKTQGSIENISK